MWKSVLSRDFPVVSLSSKFVTSQYSKSVTYKLATYPSTETLPSLRGNGFNGFWALLDNIKQNNLNPSILVSSLC